MHLFGSKLQKFSRGGGSSDPLCRILIRPKLHKKPTRRKLIRRKLHKKRRKRPLKCIFLGYKLARKLIRRGKKSFMRGGNDRNAQYISLQCIGIVNPSPKKLASVALVFLEKICNFRKIEYFPFLLYIFSIFFT